MWPGMIRQRESAERKFKYKKEVLQQVLEVWFLTDRWLCSTERSALGLGLIGAAKLTGPEVAAREQKLTSPYVVSARIPTSNSSLAYRGPTQLEKCTIWPAKLSRNVGKVVVWTCHGKKKYREYPKEYRIQSFLTIYTNSCKLYRSLEWKVDLTFKDIEERVDILKKTAICCPHGMLRQPIVTMCLKAVSKLSQNILDVLPM